MGVVVNCMFLMICTSCFFAAIVALKCHQCGQYNDGVGSITPCINSSYMQLKDCPSLDHRYCIKYMSEGSTVRDCVAECAEREDWGAKTFCCSEDGCNNSIVTRSSFLSALITIFLAAVAH